VPSTNAAYNVRDPRGWCGDPARGAALGRVSIRSLPIDYTGIISVFPIKLYDGDYDGNGTYFGFVPERPLWWIHAKKGELELDTVLRGPPAEVVAHIYAYHPRATVAFRKTSIRRGRKKKVIKADCLGIHTRGDGSWWAKDGQGIELCRVCDLCEAKKLAQYRPEILQHYNQLDVDEPIEPEG
jgi:hypothetical protein